MMISISSIRRDGGTQARMQMDRAAVEEYAERMKEGVVFPPVHLFSEGNVSWLADGFHRVEAAILAGLQEIDAVVQQGGLRDARLFAIGANAHHGVRRTIEDKRMAVNMMLQDLEWSSRSDREIARHCCVSNTFVSNLRAKLNTPAGVNVNTEKTSKKTIEQPIKQEVEPAHVPEADFGNTAETSTSAHLEPAVKASFTPAPEPEPSGNPGELEALRAEVEELKEKLSDTCEILSATQEELEAARRVLDAEDLLAQFDKEVKRIQEQDRILKARNNGLMNENADLKGMLKSARRKIERLEKGQVAA